MTFLNQFQCFRLFCEIRIQLEMETFDDVTWRGYAGAVCAIFAGMVALKGVKGAVLSVLEVYKST